MKRFHHSLRLWVTIVALTAALLDSQLSLLAAEAVAPQPDPSPIADANSVEAEATPSPTAAAPEAIAPEASPPASVAPAAQPDPAPSPAAPSPAAQAPATTPQTIRLEAARQRVEAHLAAIVARDQAAKAAQLQQNLITAALHYAEVGDFEQARLTAQHPALPEAVQTETLAKIDAIALLQQGTNAVATVAAATAPIATAPTAAAPSAVTVAPVRRALPPVPARVAVRSPQFRPAIAIGNRCLPQQASLLSVSAPAAVEAAIASPPIKASGTLVSVKPSATKAVVRTAVAIPESIELRALNQQSARPVQAIEVKLTRLATSIPALIKPSPEVASPQTEQWRLSGFVGSIVKTSKQTASTATNALPSLPVVYVDAKVNRPQTTRPAAVPAVATNATNCGGSGLTVSYPTRSSLQRLAQLGFAFPLPIPAAITSAFGWRIHPISGDRRFHAGIDFGAPMGTPVLAALPGQVVVAGDRGGYGLTVILENQGHRNLYGHLSAIAVQPGQVVEAGSVIGWVGSTGNSTGPHLHFESQYLTDQGWQAVDPLVNGTLARGR